MKTLQLLPYAACILFAGFASAAPDDDTAKFVEICSGTEDKDFDWIVNPALVETVKNDAVKKAAAMYEVLATHQTIARFDGYRNIVCHGRTALCPDRCGHSTVVAGFTIVSYLDHHKGGQYGDGKQKFFEVDVLRPVPGQSPGVVDAIGQLKPGDIVRLDWQHLYMHDGGANYPARPVNNIVPSKLPEGVALPPSPESGKYEDTRPGAVSVTKVVNKVPVPGSKAGKEG